MPGKYAARPSDLAWLVDSGTYSALLGLSEFLTVDKAGPLATAQTGQIGFVDGIPVFVSAEMPLTQADGKVGHRLEHQGPGGLRLPAGLVRGLPAQDRGQRGLPVLLRQLPVDGDGAAGFRPL